MNINMTREQLLARLHELLPQAERYDAERMAKHREAEKAYLQQFKAACREAAKWDYATAKANHFDPRCLLPTTSDTWGANRHTSPACPILVAPGVKRALRHMEMDSRTRVTISMRGQTSWLYEVVTWTPNPEDPSGGCR